MINNFMEIQYYSHTCSCGCGGQIEIKEHHKWYGVPLYISGHNTLTKERKTCSYKECSNSVKTPRNRYCSHECYSLSLMGKSTWNKDKPWSKEHRQKLSKIHTGKILSEEHRNNIGKALEGEKSHFYGKHFFGELSPNWQGGISFEPYAPEFNKELKQFIRNRDLNICQTPNCMETEGLCVHHIDYNKKNNNPENLVTLCRSCHSKTNGKNKRKYFTEFYQEVITINLQEIEKWL